MRTFFTTLPGKETMRIISWNVRFDNKDARELIAHAFSLSPDILCLQELEMEHIAWIRSSFPHHYVYGCLEVSHTDPSKQHFVCTITKNRAAEVRVINYDQNYRRSLYEKFFFMGMHHWTERHAALVTSVPFGTGQLRIVNMHLSVAVSAHERINGFRFVMRSAGDLMTPTVFCGDFNIIDNLFYRLSLGWLFNYSKGDYKTNERRIFDQIFKRFGLVNIFRDMSTLMVPGRGWQLDHILVSDFVRVTNYVIGKKRFASDHRMILADVTARFG